ncbi:hypothetical protein [Hugenholtzia roseola]|uniref:hypothetical protein n=1 Tax=Hugenholtzia roseola TaxID=1002 RepID=UPI000414284F|nr:hypothetical protein [Hugenholtzia roseola]
MMHYSFSQTLISQIPDLHTARFAAGMGATICSFRAADFGLSDLKEICGWLQGVEIWVENPPLSDWESYDFVAGFVFDNDFYIKNRAEIEAAKIEKTLALRLTLPKVESAVFPIANFSQLILACESGQAWQKLNVEGLQAIGFEGLERVFIEGQPDFYSSLSPQDFDKQQVAISVADLADFEPLYEWFEKYEA